MKWLRAVWMLMALALGGQNVSGQLLFVSQTPDDFKRWFVWDTVPDRPGLVLRFDVTTYRGKLVHSPHWRSFVNYHVRGDIATWASA